MTDNVIELRRLLDERGIEYEGYGCEITLRHDGRTYRIWAYDDERLAMSIAYLTPEQAIAATLDVSRCRDCEHIVKTSNPMTTSGYWCVENDNPRDLDGFCDYFERRKGEIEEVG